MRPNTMKRIVSGDYYQSLAEILKLPMLPDVFRLPQILSEDTLVGPFYEFVTEKSVREALDAIDVSSLFFTF